MHTSHEGSGRPSAVAAALGHLRAQAASFPGDAGGGVAVLVGLSLTVLIGASGMAADFGLLMHQRQALQRAADAAAIVTTRQLSMASIADQGRIDAVARAAANAQLGLSASDQSVTILTQPITGQNGVSVTVSQKPRPGLFGLFAPPDEISAEASARRSGTGRICMLVLSHGDYLDRREVIKLEDEAKAFGQDCGFFSNSKSKEGVNVAANATLGAGVICSAGGFVPGGIYQGEQRPDCPVIDNPLQDVASPTPGACANLDKDGRPAELVIDRTKMPAGGEPYLLRAGTYCKGITIKDKETRVKLVPNGANNVLIVSDGDLTVDRATLFSTEDAGVAVAFVGKGARFDFRGESTVSLYGAVGGPLAGILFHGSLTASEYIEYKVTSDYARVLVGTIYIPKGFLTIDAGHKVADLSAYTAIVATKIKLKNKPELRLNTNYHQTKVPVPDKVRGMMGPVQLTR